MIARIIRGSESSCPLFSFYLLHSAYASMCYQTRIRSHFYSPIPLFTPSHFHSKFDSIATKLVPILTDTWLRTLARTLSSDRRRHISPGIAGNGGFCSYIMCKQKPRHLAVDCGRWNLWLHDRLSLGDNVCPLLPTFFLFLVIYFVCLQTWKLGRIMGIN